MACGPRLIRVYVVRMKKVCVLSYPLSAQRRLIRLGGCPSWSQSWLGAQSFSWVCHEAAQLMINGIPIPAISDTVLVYMITFALSAELSLISLQNIQIKIEPGHEKICLMSYANNKGADQPAHPCSLISAFVVRCIDSIISLDSIAEISRT